MNIIAYHGSFEDFGKFSYDFVGTKSGTIGAGFGLYFSESKADALGYGDIVYTCLLELQNNVSNEKLTIPKHILKSILNELRDEYGKDYYQNYGETYDEDYIINILVNINETDTDLIGDIINSTFGGKCVEMMELLTKYGYTHTIDNETPEDPTINHYIIYDLNSITIQEKFNIKENKTLNESEESGKATSKAQRRLFAMALSYKRGELDEKYASDQIKELSKLDEETLKSRAKTNQKRRKKDGSVGKRNNIPYKVEK